jgi:hypothetical protein
LCPARNRRQGRNRQLSVLLKLEVRDEYKHWEDSVSQTIEALELRLTDEQMAAIRQRIARRKRQIKECGQIELGEINGLEDLQSAMAEIEQSKRPAWM